MNRRKHKVEDIIAAVKKADGVQSRAAGFLGVSVRTMQHYVAKIPQVKQAVEDAKDELRDIVDTGLAAYARGIVEEYVLDDQGNFLRDANGKKLKRKKLVRDSDRITVLKFLAATIGKDRGYSKRYIQAGDESAPVQVKVETSFTGLSSEEKKELASLLEKSVARSVEVPGKG